MTSIPSYNIEIKYKIKYKINNNDDFDNIICSIFDIVTSTNGKIQVYDKDEIENEIIAINISINFNDYFDIIHFLDILPKEYIVIWIFKYETDNIAIKLYSHNKKANHIKMDQLDKEIFKKTLTRLVDK